MSDVSDSDADMTNTVARQRDRVPRFIPPQGASKKQPEPEPASAASEAAALRALRQQVELLEAQNKELKDRQPDAMRNEEVSKRFVELNARNR